MLYPLSYGGGCRFRMTFYHGMKGRPHPHEGPCRRMCDLKRSKHGFDGHRLMRVREFWLKLAEKRSFQSIRMLVPKRP